MKESLSLLNRHIFLLAAGVILLVGCSEVHKLTIKNNMPSKKLVLITFKEKDVARGKILRFDPSAGKNKNELYLASPTGSIFPISFKWRPGILLKPSSVRISDTTAVKIGCYYYDSKDQPREYLYSYLDLKKMNWIIEIDSNGNIGKAR